MTYQEFLKSQGATDEDIKLLATPVSIRAFDAQQQAVADATASAAAAAKAKTDYEARVNQWHTEQILPAYQQMESDKIKTEAELARAKSVLLSAQDAGLLRLADDMGYKRDGAPGGSGAQPANGAPAGFDASKFVTQDSIKTFADSAGDGLAAMMDIIPEHAQLFPDKPLNVRTLRREAVAAGKNVEQYWMEKYGIPAAREKRDADQKAAYEKRLREEGADAATQAMADRYGNPDTRPLVPSISPLAPRPADSARAKMPWDTGDLSNDRVRRATAAVIAQQTGGAGRTN